MLKSSSRGLVVAAAVVAAVALTPTIAVGQTQAPASTGARTPNGEPNFNGIWQVMNTAAWNIQDQTGAFGIPPGQGVVEGNDIPYQPWAAGKKKENLANWRTADPEAKCFQPGVPRATYMPYPFQIIQTPKYVVIAYEYAHARRIIYTDGSKHFEGVDSWMGDSRGRWEGDTLVVDVTNFNDQTWFDRAGNFHSEALHVVERYTPDGPNRITYEVTIEDPKVFTRPWKMSMPLYRRMDKNLKLLEYECVIYLQEERFNKASSR